MKLMSMLNFVIKYSMPQTCGESESESLLMYSFWGRVNNYAAFLKEPTKLGMFVPTDEMGNILERPGYYSSFLDNSYLNHPGLINYENCIAYQKAESKLLFKGYRCLGLATIVLHDCETIEDIANKYYDVELTETAVNYIL
ncbi:hypothetical protein [Chryseobacterium sp. MEBOG07]|uniref:hypothetical protein n=1 Tax=Chryseobacterium sp. MEBOG07 TaxID=2879939 RepID=UPI001F3240B4|nr:hypothetical protein [Chryseobacterium sp. MEBOG07]UKB81245.1 hypothetical protein LF886_09720 [Chryseobacterium sp. MEBOG07]